MTDEIYGMVISSGVVSAQSHFGHIVYVGRNDPLHFIKRTPAVDYNGMSKEQRKAHDKEERARNLVFGDWIRFTGDRKGGFIRRYEKVKEMATVRSYDGTNQVEMTLVFRKVHGVLRCESLLFGEVEVPPSFENAFLVDVAYDCWTIVKVSRIMTVSFSLYAFIRVSESQGDVFNVHWNIGKKRFSPFIQFDGLKDNISKKKRSNAPVHPERLLYILAVVICNGQVFCRDLTSEKVFFAYTSPGRHINVGTAIRCDVLWVPQIDAYIVTRHWPVQKPKPTHVGKSSYDLPGESLSARCLWTERLPLGYFWSWNGTLGVIHDPRGLGVPLFLSESTRRKRYYLEVTDAGANSFSRFAVSAVNSPGTVELRERAMNDDGIKHLVGMGIVLGDGRVLLPCCSTLLLQCTSETVPTNWAELAPGGWISFEAHLCPDWRTFHIRSFRALDDVSPLEAFFASEEVGFAFKSMCEWNASCSVLVSKEFGFVDDPNWVLTMEEKQKPAAFPLWLVKGDDTSRTPLIVYTKSLPGTEQPVEEDLEEAGVVFNHLTR